jgi:lipoate-protein ligase B
MQLEIRRQPGWTYDALNQRQREIAARVREGGEGALLLSEVEPVITLGRRAGPSDLLMSVEQLRGRGIEVFPTDRGGLATYHGPGQWVFFCVDRLDRLTGDPRGVRKAVESLLEIAAAAARESRSDVQIRGGLETGVWSRRGKLASIGVHIEDGILLHGLALNAFRTPTSFVGLRPCGLDACADFLWEQADEAAFGDLGRRLVAAAGEVFSAVDADGVRSYKVSASRSFDVGS